MKLLYVHLQFCQCSHLDKIHGHLGSLHWGWTSQGWLVDETHHCLMQYQCSSPLIVYMLMLKGLIYENLAATETNADPCYLMCR